MIKSPRVFYGWYIIGLTVISMMLIYGVRNSFSVLFDPILDSFDWFRGSTAIMLSLSIFVYGITAPVAGVLADRWKPRNMAVMGIFTLALATALCYFAGELWHFYLLFGVMAPIGSAFCGTPILNPAMVNWFDKRRGLVIGIGQCGGSLSFAYSLLVQLVISQWDWRPSFLFMGGMVVVVLLPLYLILFRYRPADKGLKAYGADEAVIETEQENAGSKTTDWTLGTALRTSQLWLLVFGQLCFWGIGNYLVLAHQVKFAVDAKYSSITAASVFSLFGIVSIVGQICASISDRIGREKTVTIAVVLAIGAMLALLSVKDNTQPWLLYLYAVSFGFAAGLYTPNLFAGVADIFHGRNIGGISAMLLTGLGVGGAIGPWLGGYIYDISGSYTIAFIISIAAYAVAGVTFWMAAPRKGEELRARLTSPVRDSRTSPDKLS